MSRETSTAKESNANDVSVILQCAPDDFRDFISGLLGKPQTITKYISGPFELNKDDIENFFHLVTQRVNQQNEATLIQFTVRMVYDDNSTVLLNSLQDFKNYHEVRAITSTAVYLSWTFLVRFPDRRTPEKQQVDVSINANYDAPVIPDEFDRRILIGALTRKGSFNFRISHTARTWGADIEALLTGHIETLIKKPPALKRFISKRSARIGFVVGLLFFLSSMGACFYTTQAVLTARLQEVQQLTTSDARLDYAVKLIASGAWPRLFFYILCFLFVALVVSVFLGIWAGVKADTQEPSFLLLSKQAEKERRTQLAKNKRDWMLFGVSLLTSIVTGVIGNVLFAMFLQKWLSR